LSEDLGGFRERILPGAIQFDDDVRADFNHDPNCILGRTKAGTLNLSVDNHGVRMEADAPETTWANDLLVSIRRGDINKGSFAFRVMPGGERSDTDQNGQMVRTLTNILVRRVSIVSDPAYTATAIDVRSHHNPSPQHSTGLPLELLRRRPDFSAQKTQSVTIPQYCRPTTGAACPRLARNSGEADSTDQISK